MPVVIACLYVLWAAVGQTTGPLETWLAAFGTVLAIVGQALRFFTLGWVPEGTSGQNLTLQASTLNTRGPYSYVRNPLYVGNFGIVAGLLFISANWVVAVIGLVFFFGEYFFIIRAEEHFLRTKFGAAFDEFVAKVPRWVPRTSPAYEGGRLRDGGFDWRRALKKEINPFAAWVSGAVVVVLWLRWSHGALDGLSLMALVGVWSLTMLALLVIKAWKKGWFSS